MRPFSTRFAMIQTAFCHVNPLPNSLHTEWSIHVDNMRLIDLLPASARSSLTIRDLVPDS